MATEPRSISVSGLRGWGQLAFEATEALTHVVEGMHHEIARRPPVLGKAQLEATRGVTGLVYRGIRGTTRALGKAYDAAVQQLVDSAATESLAPGVVAARAALNGIVGDHLVATRNPLAVTMSLRCHGRALDLAPGALAEAIPDARRHAVVLVHGLCMADVGWARHGHDHGAALARDLDCTVTYLHYNSGLHISTNGRALAGILDALVRAWPVPLERLSVVGHSMGGLVVRSACHHAERTGSRWLERLADVVFLGTPHLGAPLARGVHWATLTLGVSPYTAALALLGKVWSAGAADLRHGYLVDEDWLGRDPAEPALPPPTPVPLPEGVRCYAMAGYRERTGQLLGDGLVPVTSALGQASDPRRSLPIPDGRRWLATGVDHFGLLDHGGVYDKMRSWLASEC
jgi:PGAP1-like protein